MKDTAYLVFDRYGVRRMTKRPPAAEAGEFYCKVVVEVPEKFFNRAAPVAKIVVPEDFIQVPAVGVEVVGEPL